VSPEGEHREITADRLELRLEPFLAQALADECERLSVSRNELVEFAIAYYLADLDSGRIARRVPGGPAGSAEP
jgi:hypothetical protein